MDNIQKKELKSFDALIDQYNKDNDQSFDSSEKLMERNYNTGKELAKSVLREFPNFPDGTRKDFPFYDFKNHFLSYCLCLRDSDKNLLFWNRYKSTLQDYAVILQKDIKYVLVTIQSLGETHGVEDVWEEYCNSNETRVCQ